MTQMKQEEKEEICHRFTFTMCYHYIFDYRYFKTGVIGYVGTLCTFI